MEFLADWAQDCVRALSLEPFRNGVRLRAKSRIRGFSHYHMTSLMRRFAIIGAGPAGLAAVQQLRAVAGEVPIDISVFERRASVGGVWNYEPQTGPCHIHMPIPAKFREVGYATSSENPHKVIAPSAMYEGLRTNVPSVRTASTHSSLSWHSAVHPSHPMPTCFHLALTCTTTSSTLHARKTCLT